MAVACQIGAGIGESSSGFSELEDGAPGSGLKRASAGCPCCCILFGLGTCASSSGLREVTVLRQCPQNTNSLGIPSDTWNVLQNLWWEPEPAGASIL